MKKPTTIFLTIAAIIMSLTYSAHLVSAADTIQNIFGVGLTFVTLLLAWKVKLGFDYKGLLSVMVMAFFVSSCTRIDAGHEGVRVNLTSSDKGVDNVSLVTGWQFYNPMFTSLYEFPTYVRTIDYEPFEVNAKDGSVFTVDPTLSIKVIDGHSPRIFKKYRKPLDEIIRTTLFNYVRDAFRIQFNSFTTDSLISNRAEFEQMVQHMLDTALVNEGFKLEQLTSGISYPPSIVQAIEAKNRAIQDAMRVQNELAKAKANAEIKLTEARAQSESQRLLEQTLTDKLLQKEFIEKWDGKLPVYGEVPKMFKQVQ
jgi:regulator of protease activity HflC (stomatin/prohibitin superfamily)